MGRKLFFSTFIAIFLLAACSSARQGEFVPDNLFDQHPNYLFSDYGKKEGIAKTDFDTKIELEDGAWIAMPFGSVREDAIIKIERNHEKINELPLLGEDAILLSDLYSFHVVGDLVGPVDISLPFNLDLIPERDGLLAIATHEMGGWVYQPVIPEGNQVTLFGKKLGDHVIVWHFVDSENEYLNYKIDAICDPRIALQVLAGNSKGEDSLTVVGSLLPFSDDYSFREGDWLDSLFSETDDGNITEEKEITLIFNVDQEVSITTELDGSFQYSVNIYDGKLLGAGLNQIEAVAECDSLFGVSKEIFGYASFDWDVLRNQDENSLLIDDASDAEVLLPSFVGQPSEDAEKWLEENEFKYIVIDGSSYLDLGMVYEQAPTGEQHINPYRNVIILFNTTDKLPTLPLTYIVNECIENFFRVMRVDSENELGFSLSEPQGSCDGQWGETITSIEQVDENIIKYFWHSGERSGEVEINLSTVVGLTNPVPTDRHIVWSIGEFTWAEDWGEGLSTAYEIKFVREEIISILGYSRLAMVYEGEYEEHVIFTQYDNTSISESRKSIYYFDKVTGFNLRVEHFKWLDTCSPDCSEFAGELTAKTVHELVETDWDLAN